MEEDQKPAINPGTGPVDWSLDDDLDDNLLADEDDVQQFAVPGPPSAYSWDASQADDSRSLSNIWRTLSWLLVPIPFALIIFLFSLLADSRGVTNLAPLPLGIVLLFLVVVQGTLLYYAGNNDTLWTLALLGGYSLFLLVGAFVFFGFSGAVFLLVILLLLAIIFGSRSIRQVPEGRVEIVQRFGQYNRTLLPGLRLLFPWESIHSHVNTKETTWTTFPPVHFTTPRGQEVELVASVTYQLLPEDAYIAILQIADWEKDLHLHFLGVLKSVISELTPDDFIGWSHAIHSRPQIIDELANPLAETRWDRLNAALLRRLQDHVATRGIKVNMVHMQDITVISLSSHSTASIGSLPVNAGVARSHPGPTPNVPLPSQPAQVVLPAPPPETAAPPLKLTPIRMQGMVDMFNSVREGRINDLTTIAKLQHDFEQIASTPELDALFPYDAKLAAKTLQERIDAFKAAQAAAEASRASVPTPATAPQPARPARRLPFLPDDNLAAGG